MPVAVTFMGKGAIDDRSHLSLMAVGLQARDHVLTGFDRADLVICVGYDLVEYAPARWNPDGRKRIIHIDTQPAEVDAALPAGGRADRRHRRARCGGCSPRSCRAASAAATPASATRPARRSSTPTCGTRSSPSSAPTPRATGWPITPQRAIADLRRGARPRRTSSCRDVGAHKVWVARLYQAYEPNTVIISNGFAAMGISLPGAIAAKLVHPDRKVVALCGDGGFLMNSQELETAKRIGANITVVVWRDDGYGLIDWKQRNEFGRPFGGRVRQPGLRRLRRVVRDRRVPAGVRGRPRTRRSMRALDVDGPSLVEVPIDYRENLRLTERLGALAAF